MIDPTFRNVNRVFGQVGNGNPTRNPFIKYYMSFAEKSVN